MKQTLNDAFSSDVDYHDRFHCPTKSVPLLITRSLLLTISLTSPAKNTYLILHEKNENSE